MPGHPMKVTNAHDVLAENRKFRAEKFNFGGVSPELE